MDLYPQLALKHPQPKEKLMSYAPMDKAAWYADGLRWIGTVFIDAADALDHPSLTSAPLEPVPAYKPIDEFLYDVRFKMQNRI